MVFLLNIVEGILDFLTSSCAPRYRPLFVNGIKNTAAINLDLRRAEKTALPSDLSLFQTATYTATAP